MTSVRLRFIYADQPGPTPPTPVEEPLDSWLVTAGNGRPARVKMDEFFEDRSDKLAQTNMTRKHTIYTDPEHTPSGKIIIRIDGTPWAHWLYDLLGEKNYEAFITPADGFMDTRDPTTTELPLMVCPSGGALLNIKESVRIHGNWWDIVETMDFWEFPVKVDGVWYYRGEAMSYRTHPHLFFARTNRVSTKIQTWLTRNLINAATDGGIRGGKGDEYWFSVSKVPAAQPRYQLKEYPTLPQQMRIYNDSVIVDGNLVERKNYKDVFVDAYRFQGSNSFVRDEDTQLWYKAEEMLVRANAALYAPGNGFDYRCYVSTMDRLGDPFNGFLGYPPPVCGWTGLERNFLTFLRGLFGR